MRTANILTLIAAAVWTALLLIAYDLLGGVAERTGGRVSLAQVDFYVWIPTLVVIIIVALAWMCNALQRWAAFLAVMAGASLVGLLPFLLAFGGGV